jgi:L-alanine-DL-glutamate epimerase-like enolase superfamily enzyme
LVKIARVESFVLHVPVTRGGIADSTHQLTHWGVPGALIYTDDGLVGCGFTGTHAHLSSDRLIADCIAEVYGPLLVGEDPGAVRHLWSRLLHHPPVQWVGRAGITHLALSAIDIALWDLKARYAGLPLFRLLGGTPEKRIEAYNTDGGWLNWTQEQLVEDSRGLIAQGYRGVKIKVGRPDVTEDIARLSAVRQAIGPAVQMMVDANGRWDLPHALDFARRAAPLNLKWMEEPLWYDDVAGHRQLALRGGIPIALGEQLYTVDHFTQFISAGAVDFVQPDAVRLAGITEWLLAADLAYAHRLPVVSHVGDMAQVHLHLAMAHPACRLLEYIPWLRDCMEEPATVSDGYFRAPAAVGAGTAFRPDAFERYRVQ